MMRFAAALTFAAASQVQCALVTTDLVYSTADFLYETGSSAWQSSGVDKLMAQVPLADLQKQMEPHIAQVTGIIDQQLKQNTGKSLDSVLKEVQIARVQAQVAATQAFGEVYAPANAAAVDTITRLEATFPAHKGLIGKSLGNLILFVLYLFFVIYVVGTILRFVIRLAFSIVNCVCCTILCCGCCRSTPAPTNAAAKAGAKQNAKAAAKKAAVKSNGKK